MSKCGTYAGWNAHRIAKQTPCRDCKDAQARYNRAWRATKGRKDRGINFPQDDRPRLVPDFDGLGAVIASAFRESA